MELKEKQLWNLRTNSLGSGEQPTVEVEDN